MRAAALAAFLVVTPALAQTALPAFELERLRLHPGAAQGLLVDTGDFLAPWSYRAALTFHYEHAPLVVTSNDAPVSSLVAARWTAHVSAALAPTDFLEVGAQLPLVLGQPGDATPPFNLAPVATGFGVGTGYLHARLAVLQEKKGWPLDVSGGVAVGLPFGMREALTSEQSVTAVPTVALGRTLTSFLRVGGSVAVLLRPTRGLTATNAARLGNELGSYFTVSASVATLGAGLRGELAGRFDVPFTHSPLSGELTLGARYPLLERLEVYALAGPGFGQQAGVPAFRLLVGVALVPPREAPRPPPAPPPTCVAGQPHAVAECPRLDFDGDGVPNEEDVCPQNMGRDVAGKTRGCPELDADGDGVLDGADQCPTVPGLSALAGCLPPDGDGDGVPDARDACPAIAAPRSLRGCLDVDGDGLDSLEDACPEVAGVAELKGCPDQDSDGDGVVDRLDACRNAKGGRANQGCPDAEKLLVVITRDRLVIRDKVYFATGRSEVLKQSFALLQQIARILREHPEVEHVSIEGHTDARGTREANLKLSEARAESVRRFLVAAGVPLERVSAKGFGPDRPVETNETARGREANRRVDFVIVGTEEVRQDP